VILHSIMLQIIYTTVDRVKRLIEEEQTTQWTKKGQWNICVTNDHRYVPLVANMSVSFPHS
jgi:hypothetical protein